MKLSVLKILTTLSKAEFIGNKSHEINQIISLNELIDIENQHQYLTWCSLKNQNLLSSLKNATIICDKKTETLYLKNKNCNFILVDNPRIAFKTILTDFFVTNTSHICKIESTAIIDKSVILGNNISIGHNVIIEKNVKIGDNCQIKHNSILHENSIVGNNVKIGCNCTIGGLGFGYELNEKGEYEFIPHIGNVIIEDNVEIGNNTCIDKAVLGSTKIMRNVKIDNLVHIAHGAKIGENSLIIANSVIAGSSTIGKNVWVAPSANIKNNLTIGDNSIIGIGAVVLKNVSNNVTIIGNPGRELIK